MGKVYIGTSGWQYKHWKEIFYPENLPQKDWLKYYSQHFNTVEINSSFYRLPKRETFEKWKSQVGNNFIFSIKGNRFITHVKRLKDCREPLKRFFENADALIKAKSKTNHVILWQLPPNLKKDLIRLRTFLKTLPKNFRHAFEFRHENWMDAKVFELFEGQKGMKVTAVLQDWYDWPVLDKPIGDFVYIRFHGKKKLYSSNYENEELEEWVKKMRQWKKCGLDIYAYFNNDALGYAPDNAAELRELI
ncbi:MAG: DUF72 domain-containing protein [Microgenomates group bacterium]